MPGEVDQEPVVGLDLSRQGLSEEGPQPAQGDVLGEPVDGVPVVLLEHLGDPPGVVDRRAEWGDAVAVRVDADDDRLALPEADHDGPPPGGAMGYVHGISTSRSSSLIPELSGFDVASRASPPWKAQGRPRRENSMYGRATAKANHLAIAALSQHV